jgi:hypothetical protein
VAKSVDELAQLEQITEPAKIVGIAIGIDRRRSSDWIYVPIGPACRDQRSTTVRQNCEKIVDAAPPDGADHEQRMAFEGMTLACDRHRIRDIMAMGSLWPLPSTRSARSGWYASWSIGSVTGASSA